VERTSRSVDEIVRKEDGTNAELAPLLALLAALFNPLATLVAFPRAPDAAEGRIDGATDAAEETLLDAAETTEEATEEASAAAAAALPRADEVVAGAEAEEETAAAATAGAEEDALPPLRLEEEKRRSGRGGEEDANKTDHLSSEPAATTIAALEIDCPTELVIHRV
jgi:hypothetical protein